MHPVNIYIMPSSLISMITVYIDLTSNCTDGEIRLMGGTSYTEGRVELCRGGIWGTVCDDFWSSIDARVVCSQLQYPTFGM